MANPVVPARGMRDILPSEKTKRDRILQIIRDVYQHAGFSEIETPAVEPLTRLLSDQGGENEKMIFEIMRRGLPADQPVAPSDATDLGLRYDLTVPLTRYYASNAASLPRVFRSLQTGPVWRAERPQKGRYRQFTQCDIDILGDPSPVAEVDLVTTTLRAFQALGMGDDIKLLINDRRILLDLLDASGVDPADRDETLIILDKADKIGTPAVREELLQKGLASAEGADRLLGLVAALKEVGKPSDAPLTTGEFVTEDGAVISMRDLPQIVQAVTSLVPGVAVEFDATLVRGMGYYTGPIFEIAHRDRNFSVAGGGRYDGVVGQWLGRDVPACGFSIGFERIVDLVDLPSLDADRIALLYRPGADPTALLQLREDLQASREGAVVALVVPPRRLSAQFFDSLVGEGYTHYLDGRGEDPSAADLRELKTP